MFHKIALERPVALFSFIHPDDLAGAFVLAMIKKYTKIKILYFHHASHFPSIGMRFSELVLEAAPLFACITKNKCKIDHVHVCGMLSKTVDAFVEISSFAIAQKREEIGICKDFLCTMSGGSSYKFFDSGTSDYFEMVKVLLTRNHSLQHVVISEFSPEQLKVIGSIMGDADVASRLIILPFTTDYELVFQCADVFVDSFPIGSALTQIDLMRLKVPSVVKINRENPIWTFHQYQMEDYAYMFDSIGEVICGVETLLYDKEESQRVVLENFDFYMQTYEGSVVKERLCNLISNSEDMELFRTDIDDEQCTQYLLPENIDDANK